MQIYKKGEQIKKADFELKVSKITNERQYWIKMFLDELNSKRLNYKSLTAGFVASKMADAGLKTTRDLQDFYDECKRASSFSKYWWWSMRAK